MRSACSEISWKTSKEAQNEQNRVGHDEMPSEEAALDSRTALAMYPWSGGDRP